MAAASSSKEAEVAGESATFIPSAISEEIRIRQTSGLSTDEWLVDRRVACRQTSGLSTDESKAISKKFELEFEDPAFSIKPPKLDGFMLRHANEKDQGKAVNASEEAQITDIAPPLLDLYTKVCSLDEGKQWCRPKIFWTVFQ
jgi:hypothetical protein